MRYLCIDLGDRRTGLALGDAVTRIASPLAVLEVALAERAGESLIDALAHACEQHLGAGDALVFGLPLNMDGTEGAPAKKVRDLAARVAARTAREAHFQDERLTSADADWRMARSGMTRGEKKQRRDALAAAAILRDFLARESV